MYRFLAKNLQPELPPFELVDKDCALPPDEEMLAFPKGDLPEIAADATGLRLGNLLDFIGETHYAGLREAMLRRLAYASWQQHRDATLVRTVFGVVSVPGAAEFKNGERESYDVLYAYDFRFSSP